MNGKQQGHYEGPGLIWDEGEIPACHYCRKKVTVVRLQVTNVDDWVICYSAVCLVKLAKENLRGAVRLVRGKRPKRSIADDMPDY